MYYFILIVEYDNIMEEMIDPSNVLDQEKLASLSKKKSNLRKYMI